MNTREFFQGIWAWITGWFGGGSKPPKIKDHRASFLMDNGATRVMNILSYNCPEAHFKHVVGKCLSNGDTVIYLYTSNVRDGAPVPTSFYVNDDLGGTIDKAKLTMMQGRMEYCRKKGLAIVAWLFADDSSRNSRDPDKIRYTQDVVKHFGEYISEYVVALEANEHMKEADCQAVALALHQLDSKKPVGIHMTTGSYGWGKAGCYDKMYFQYGFGRSPAAIESQTRSVVAALKKPVIAAEYNLSSQTNEAKAQGQAAMRGGAVGTGNGR